MLSKVFFLLLVAAAPLIADCAQLLQPDLSDSLAGVRLQLPSTGNWRLLDTADVDQRRSISFVQYDPSMESRIQSAFTVKVLDNSDVGADPCLSFVARVTRGIKHGSEPEPGDKSDCKTTVPGNQYTSDWFEKNGGALKEVTTKTGLRFVDGGVGEVMVSVPYGTTRRLSLVGYLTMGAPVANSRLPTDRAKRRLGTFADDLLKAASGASDAENFTLKFPSVVPIEQIGAQ